ncbi:hypothetical protein ACGF0D_34680 [Kitasatospora sp. NPDC048298]|uniref:hypothetical protein n=1 Tax=Kitasatospora sp. NPDC048298 TaxID=3364049 RepID=UPI00371B6BFC
MIGTKYVFEQSLDYDAPVSSEYLNVIYEVYAEPRAVSLDRTRDGSHELTYNTSERDSQQQSPLSPFNEALESLRAPGAVLVLARPPGTGRSITAYALYARLLHAKFIDEVRPIPFGGSQHFPVKRLPREQRCGYVLELPADEDEFQVHETFGASLVRAQHVLEKRDSRLIVLTTPEQWRRLSQGAPPGVAPDLGVARPTDIAARWLRAQEPGFPVDSWVTNSQILELLSSQSPTDVLSFVDLILEEHRRALQEGAAAESTLESRKHRTQEGPPTSFEQQVANVVAARSNWEEDLYKWHVDESRTEFHRNFLLTASVLRGDSVGHVYAKAADLTEELGGEAVPISGQQAPGVIAMTRAVNARRNSDGTLKFDQPHWDDAALEYFWNDRPLARTKFLRWLARAPLDEAKAKEALESANRDDRRALAVRIGEFAVRWAVRHRRQEPLEEIVKAWHEHGIDKELWPIAIALLDRAAVQDVSARYIHTMLLGWAGRKGEVSIQLAVLAVCTGEFGRNHTGKALRRLRHTAGSGNPDVAKALRDAVQVLWSDPSVRRTLFEYVAEWCGDQKTRDTVGRRTFAALAASAHPKSGLPLLFDDTGLEEAEAEDSFQPSVAALVTCWRALLSQGPGPLGEREVDAAVFLWLDAALHRPQLKSVVLETLRQAVAVRGLEGPNLRETLRGCAHGWVQGQGRSFSQDREELRRELSVLLDSDLLARKRQPGQGGADREALARNSQEVVQDEPALPRSTGANAT